MDHIINNYQRRYWSFLLGLHPYNSRRKAIRTYQSSGMIRIDLVVIGGIRSCLTTLSLSLLALKVLKKNNCLVKCRFFHCTILRDLDCAHYLTNISISYSDEIERRNDQS